MAYFMDNLTVRELQEALTKTKTVIIPIGVVEQHGYHLPLTTDIISAVEIPRIAGDRLNAVVAPSVNYCFSGGELTGTINVNPNIFGLYICDICEEFFKIGFLDVILFLGHGGTDNTNALKSSVQSLLRRDHEKASRVTVSIFDCIECSPTAMELIFGGDGEHDFHAGMVETSLVKYWKPEVVRDEIVMDEEEIARSMRTDCNWFEIKEKTIDTPYVIPHAMQRKEIKVGVMGFPEKANVELGKTISDEMVRGLIDYVNFIEQKRKEF